MDRKLVVCEEDLWGYQVGLGVLLQRDFTPS